MGKAGGMTSRSSLALPLLLGVLVLALLPPSASAGYPIAKDGKIYACFKAKGRGKGTVRVIRNAKVRCPRKWRKMAWNATVRPGPQGSAGAAGAAGPGGQQGPAGGTSSLAVKGLEDKVSELLTRIEGLEDLIPTVQSLCTQAEVLTDQVNAVETALSGLGLNGVLTTLGGLLEIPALPGALPSFNCPTN
jgi:hypothetical protein